MPRFIGLSFINWEIRCGVTVRLASVRRLRMTYEANARWRWSDILKSSGKFYVKWGRTL